MPQPQPTPSEHAVITQAGQRAEQRVLAALSHLPEPWQFFHTVEWRTLNAYGESVGEADVVVTVHPPIVSKQRTQNDSEQGKLEVCAKAIAIKLQLGSLIYPKQ